MSTVEKQVTEIQQQAQIASALIVATNGFIEAANSLATISEASDKAQKPAMFRRGLSRTEAANYIGVSGTKFDHLISSRHMPKPKIIGGRRVWDVYELDENFERLDNIASNKTANAWD